MTAFVRLLRVFAGRFSAFSRIKKIGFSAGIAGFGGALLLTLPALRTFIIFCGEIVVGRPLTAPIWHERLLRASFWGMSAFFLFCASFFIVKRLRNIAAAAAVAAIILICSQESWSWLLLYASVLFMGAPRFVPALTEREKTYLFRGAITFGIAAFVISALWASKINESLWLDEIYSLKLILFPFRDMIALSTHDTLPPLFYMLSKGWSLLFSSQTFSLKILTIIPSALSLILGALFLSREFSRKAALLFVLVCNASIAFLHQSIEIRPYSWAFFLALTQALSAWYVLKTKKRLWWVFFVISAVCAAYTHLYSLLCAALIYAALFLSIVIYQREQIKAALLSALVAALLFSPWIPFMLQTFMSASSDFWIPPITRAHVKEFIRYPFDSGSGFWTSLLCVLFAGTAAGAYRAVKARSGKDAFWIYTLLACPLLLLGIGLAVSFLTRPLLVSRYLYPAAGLLFLFFAINAGAARNKRLFVWICAVCVMASLNAHKVFYRMERAEGENYRLFTRFVHENISKNDAIVFGMSAHIPMVVSFLIPDRLYVSFDGIPSKANGPIPWARFDKREKLSSYVYPPMESYNSFLERPPPFRTAWLFTGVKEEPPEIPGARWQGTFSIAWYRFEIYRIETPQEALSYARETFQPAR